MKFWYTESMIKRRVKIPFEKIKTSKPVLSLVYLVAPLRRLIRRLYNWTMKWSTAKHAEAALGGLSFAEASFFPLPVDPLLMAMIFAEPKKWLRLTMLTTIASVLGAAFGYFIGAVLFESFGTAILNGLHLKDSFASVQALYQEHSFMILIVAAFTPLPFKVFTIAGGAFSVNFAGFMIASLVGRTLRFGAVGSLAHFLGKRYKDQIEKYVDIASLIVLAILLVGYILYRLVA